MKHPNIQEIFVSIRSGNTRFDDRAELYGNLLRMGLVTVNEIRSLEGLPSLPAAPAAAVEGAK